MPPSPAVVVIATSCVVIGLVKIPAWRDIASGMCELLSAAPVICSDVARDAFTQTNVDPVAGVQGHTHASAAAHRTSSRNFAHNIALYCGAKLFVIGMSRSDQRKGYRGTRRWYWTKDTNANNRADKPTISDIRYLCDVDYYIDMPHLLSERAQPVLLYTVVPEEATSNGEDDTSFRFEEDGSLTTWVAGSASYNHLLWNYSFDSVLVSKTFLGISYYSVAYAIERKQVSKHRQIVLLAPIREFKGVASLLANWLLSTPKLERMKPIVYGNDGKPFVRFNVIKPDGQLMVTTAIPGTSLSATIPQEVDDSVGTVARLGTTNLMLPTTASWVEDRASAALLTEYHRSCQSKTKMVVYPVKLGVRAYQYNPKEYIPEATPKLQAFMSPLVHGAFAPVNLKSSEEACVEGRVNRLKKPEPKPNAFRDRCLDEFVELVVAGAVLEPFCFEVVNAKQKSAAQQLSLRKAVLNGTTRKRVLKCFLKAECYQDVKDPRNISTYNDADKLDMAMFALALSEHLKQFAWYGPGKTPVEVATRVAQICSHATFANISDYHRMDGTITYFLRLVDRGVCMKAFANHRATMNELLKRNCDNTGILPHGVKFLQGPVHGSGCSATSVFQTLRAAFCAYLAFRHTKKDNGTNYSPTEAFTSLGIHLGDDGLDANLPAESHEWAARAVGLILEVNIVQRGSRGVNFLARYYSEEVWFGRLDSMCDVKRQLSKFHTTVRLPENVTPEQKFVEKSMSYVATDGNTPVIGELCKKLLLLSSLKPRGISGVASWWSQFDASVQYPNSNDDGWMDVEFDTQFPEFDRTLFKEWLDRSRTPEELLSAPLCAEPRPPTPSRVEVVVDDQVVPARQNDDRTAKQEEDKEKGTNKNPSRKKLRAKSGHPSKTRRKRVAPTSKPEKQKTP